MRRFDILEVLKVLGAEEQNTAEWLSLSLFQPRHEREGGWWMVEGAVVDARLKQQRRGPDSRRDGMEPKRQIEVQ